jgi:AcrR family transcriptional regulator
MAQVADRLSRDDYFRAAMAILAEDGVAGLTTTRLCDRLQVTRGSLYHHFESGPAFHGALIDHWEQELVPGLLAAIDAVEPHARIDLLQHVALHADHDAEKAIRAWAHTNPAVAAALERVDRTREAALAKAFVDVGIEPGVAATLSRIGFSLLIGAQQLDDPIDRDRLQDVLVEYRAWIDHRRSTP